jgi:hypothetical protein
MAELFVNNAFTTVNVGAGIDDNTNPVTFAVSNPNHFPVTGNFRIKIDDEIMLVTGVSDGEFTCARGVEGSPITAHANKAAIRHVFTAGALNQRFADRYSTGPYASLPDFGSPGRRYYCTDSPYVLLDTGSEWLHYVNNLQVKPPVLADYSWVNQGTATATASKGGILLENASTAGSAYHHNILVKAAPAIPYQVVVGFYHFFPAQAYGLSQFVLRNSSDGKFTVVRISTNTGTYYGLDTVNEHFNDPTTFAGVDLFAVPSTGMYQHRHLNFLKIVDDNTNRIVYFSNNPYIFPSPPLFTLSRTYFTTPNQVGFSINIYNKPQSMHIVHYEES